MRPASLCPTLCLLLVSCSAEREERWESISIDGRSAAGFVLITRGGEIVGGHDTCNGWSLSEQPELIVMDAQECPPDSVRDAYWAVARGKGATHTRHEGKLIARGGKHIGVFDRG